MSSQAASSNSQRQTNSVSSYVEFKLRSTSSSNYLHNIMTLCGPPVNMNDFTTPVRLVRDPSCHTEERGVNEKEENTVNPRTKKKKTRIIKPEEEEYESNAGEKLPWLLEDFDGQHSYVSTLNTPDSRYVIFVNQGNEFRVLQASKWYKFWPKLSYVPLTLEEAEEKMASKGKNEDFDRWLMRKRNVSGEPSGTASVKPAAMRVATRFVDLDDEGFDFEERVDDDDGENYYGVKDGAEDDPSMLRVHERPRGRKNLTSEGKQVKKLMQVLDKTDYDDSDEGERDPYAVDVQEDEEDEAQRLIEEQQKWIQQLQHKQQQLKAEAAARQQQLQLQKQQLHSQSSNSSLTGKNKTLARSRSKSPTPSQVSSGATSRNRSKSPSVSGESSALTEVDIVAILREGPIRTKDLIARVKGKLKADPGNKELFREIVRRVASVRSSIGPDEDKMLELKTEFRT